MSKVVRTLKVTEIGETLQDKNGRNYKRVTLQAPDTMSIVDEDSGEIFNVRINARSIAINSYEESYLDDKPDLLWNSKVGDRVMGAIESRVVDQPYEIDGKSVAAYTAVVLGDTSREDWEDIVNRTFFRAGHRVKGDETDYTAVKKTTSVSVVKDTVPETEDDSTDELEETLEEEIPVTQPATRRF